MNDERHSPAEREALEALGRSAPAPDPAAKARAREAFLAGAAPARALPPRSRRRVPRPRVGLALAAAVAALFLLWFGARPAEPWRVREVVNAEGLRIGGEPRSLRVGDALGGAVLAASDSTELGLEYGCLLLRVRPGSELELPPTPGRWFGKARTLVLREGEVFGSSGDGHVDFPLTLQTPEATATLLGTTFAVFRTADATCFCLFRGGLRIQPRAGGEPIDLPVGRRVFVYDDGRPPQVEPLDAGEQMKLQMIQDAAMAP